MPCMGSWVVKFVVYILEFLFKYTEDFPPSYCKLDRDRPFNHLGFQGGHQVGTQGGLA